jgi:uncharacterized membrane protein
LAGIGAPRHRGFYFALAAGIAGGAAVLLFAPPLALVVGVNLFFAVYLAFTGLAARKLSAEFLRKHAAEEDAPAPIILVVMAAAVAVSAVSLFLVLMDDRAVLPVTLSVASVVLGWFAIHTMWAMHYAFEYYEQPEASPGGGHRQVVGGLEFPGGDDPDGTAFLYFSYVIGMTAQTSDTSVTSNAMRRLVTLHGVFSFFFNTVLVAAAINIVVSLAQ